MSSGSVKSVGLQFWIVVLDQKKRAGGMYWAKVMFYMHPPGKFRLAIDTKLGLPFHINNAQDAHESVSLLDETKLCFRGVYIEPELLCRIGTITAFSPLQRAMLRHKIEEAFWEHGSVSLVHDEFYEEHTRKRRIKIPR